MSNKTLHQYKQQQQQLVQQYKDHKVTIAKRILIVNHEDDVNLALKLVLEEGNYNNVGETEGNSNSIEVDSFNNPFSALERFRKGIYDLIIIGVMMPRMNGFELSKELRRIDEKAKICFLTAGENTSNFCGYSTSYIEGEESHHVKSIKLPIGNKDLIEQVVGMLM